MTTGCTVGAAMMENGTRSRVAEEEVEEEEEAEVLTGSQKVMK